MNNHAKILRAPDYAKALGISLVVFGHVLRGLIQSNIVLSNPFWIAIDRAIYLFHMPLFFYIAGLFFRETVARYSYVGMLKRNAFMFLLPLVVWSYAQCSLQYLFKGDANIKLSILDVLTAPFPPQQQFWFLGVLFVTTAFVGALLCLKRATMVLWLALISFFAVRVFTDDFIKTLFITNSGSSLLGQFIIHLPFFIMGVLMGPSFLGKIQAKNVFCLALLALVLWGEQIVPVAGNFVSTIASVLCVLTLYKLFLNMDQHLVQSGETRLSRITVFIGMNSMIIYLAHVICAAGFRAFLVKCGIFGIMPHILGGIGVGLFAPLLLVPVGIWMLGYCPKISKAAFPVRLKR